MSSSKNIRRGGGTVRSTDDDDRGGYGSRSRVRSSRNSTSRHNADSDEHDDSGDLFVDWDHRMNTDERRRMRKEEEEKEAVASAVKSRTGSSTNRSTIPQAGRSTSANDRSMRYDGAGAQCEQPPATSRVAKYTSSSSERDKDQVFEEHSKPEKRLSGGSKDRRRSSQWDDRSHSTRGSVTGQPLNNKSTNEAITSAQLAARNRLRERMLGNGDDLPKGTESTTSRNTQLDEYSSKGSNSARGLSSQNQFEHSAPSSLSSEPSTLNSAQETGKNLSSDSRSLEKTRNSQDEQHKPKKNKTDLQRGTSDEIVSLSRKDIGDELASISTESEDESLEKEISSEEESSEDEGQEKWSIRVSIISAVDMPNSLVPGTQLCPVLKLGLVAMPVVDDKTHDDEALEGANARLKILNKIEESGLVSIPKSRVRCTSTKILSKRDHGAVEFHEDMRWDNVRRPHGTALAVELCARAVMPPPNAHESPLPKVEATLEAHVAAPVGRANVIDRRSTGSLDLESASGLRTKSTSPHRRPQISRSSSASTPADTKPVGFGIWGKKPHPKEEDPPDQREVGGISGMRALWNKGRQQLETQRTVVKRKSATEVTGAAAASTGGELDTANAAAAVARFLTGGQPAGKNAEKNPANQGNQSETLEEEDRLLGVQDQQIQSRMGISPACQNVALIKQHKKKMRKIVMTEDVRLGAVVVPLTRLPLAKALEGKEAARIETWFPLDTSSSVQSLPGRRDGQGSSYAADRRVPRVLLEISFSSPDILDESEDEMDEPDEDGTSTCGGESVNNDEETMAGLEDTSKPLARRASSKKEVKVSTTPQPPPPLTPDTSKQEAPTLKPGVIDYICVVGAHDIGDQKLDDGSKGWVNSTPECSTLEQFPPNSEFHASNGRKCVLPDKIEWFCFPEGCKLWRGTQPPSHSDLNLRRFSASSPPNVASSIAAFDACLNCTTSFTWFVFSSTSDSYGSKNKKTFGAVIRFYAPAPTGVDPKADDYAQLLMSGGRDLSDRRQKTAAGSAKRLWVPMGICVVADLPIVGVMEAILLRICEALAARTGSTLYSSIPENVCKIVQQDLANMIINYQKPISGVLHCSIPFLQGERLHLTLPPATGLPPLPHGGSVTSVCRLLSAEGLNVLLAAILTECKILIHSDDVANLPMVAEVITALIYPFDWALPYIPVLPDTMLEFIEAPLSYLLGVPTCSLKNMDASALTDVVVIDLDNGFSSQDYLDGRRGNRTTKVPTPLPSSVANNISKAVFRLLREEDDIEVEYGSSAYPASRSLPRLESESLAEREFRISIALQVCSLVRGYQDCLFFVSASQPVFNRDRFLRNAPALFEERRGNPVFSDSLGGGGAQKMLSPRSKRFLSLFVNTQQFHGLLEVLEHEDVAFFHEIMDTFDVSEDQRDVHVSNYLCSYGSSKLEESASHLSKALQKVEDKIPTYRVDRKGQRMKGAGGVFADDDGDNGFDDFMEGDENIHDIGFSDDTLISSFTRDLLRPIVDGDRDKLEVDDDESSLASLTSQEGVRSLSVQYLVMLEKNPWRYRKLFEIPLGDDEKPKMPPSSVIIEVREKVKLKDAIGERRYRAWKLAQEKKAVSSEGSTRTLEGDTSAENAVDFKSMLSSVISDDITADTSSLTTTQSLDLSTDARRALSTLSPEQQRVVDAKDRDVLRRCLERAYDPEQKRSSRQNLGLAAGGSDPNAFVENGRDLISEAEVALQNPSAQRFLVSVLSQRSRVETKKKKRYGNEDQKGKYKQANQSNLSRVQPAAFECLVQLCCAMLDACEETSEYEPAYRLLTQTVGFCTVNEEQQIGVPMKESDDQDHNSKLVYITKRIGLHPIFADLRLWETVLSMHLKDRQEEKSVMHTGNSSGKSTLNDSRLGKGTSEEEVSTDEYDAAVATLYEMLGYGIPAEELARFATRVSEEYSWFTSERGHSLLMLARRLSVRRDVEEGASGASILDLMMAGRKIDVEGTDGLQTLGGALEDDDIQVKWSEIGWSHPAAASIRVPNALQAGNSETRTGQAGEYSLLALNGLDGEEVSRRSDSSVNDGKSSQYLKRVHITSLASFGSSVVASGGLDGSVFLAHTIQMDAGKKNNDTVCGVRLDWGTSEGRLGSATPTTGSEYEVGAISCIAAAQGVGYRHCNSPDLSELADEDDFMSAMEGCRVIAGTTGGDLRVWSVQEVYAATGLASGRNDFAAAEAITNSLSEMKIQHSSGVESATLSNPGRSAVGSVSNKLKFSTRGWALSGHRGGVSCMDLPSHLYRPDALVTGGADGLIKLWSLVRRSDGDGTASAGRIKFNRSSMVGPSAVDMAQSRGTGGSGSDALSVLTGHGGRVLCVKTAWHGDGLISGGVDRTVRIWDLAGTSGKCTNALSGHLGWVTQAHYWGPHTIVSASTDRAIALWDARAHNAPLFVLRHHHAPVSDLLVGSRTDPLMVSAACDGTVATWDVRRLSSKDNSGDKTEGKKQSQVIRQPVATMNHSVDGKGVKYSGAVLLARGASSQKKSVISVGIDAMMKEWDVGTGRSLQDISTGHCDVISSLTTFTDMPGAARVGESGDGSPSFGGTITGSWDGTVRMRRLVRKKR